jgi:hypothetical protein
MQNVIYSFDHREIVRVFSSDGHVRLGFFKLLDDSILVKSNQTINKIKLYILIFLNINSHQHVLHPFKFI